MEIIDVPEEHALLLLRSDEILALWRCLARAQESMTDRQFLDRFEIPSSHAAKLYKTLSDARDVAQANRRT